MRKNPAGSASNRPPQLMRLLNVAPIDSNHSSSLALAAARARCSDMLFAALSLLAYTPNDLSSIGSRRQFLTRLAAAVPAVAAPLAAQAVAARTGLSSPFTGEYDDPKHPGCLRSVISPPSSGRTTEWPSWARSSS